MKITKELLQRRHASEGQVAEFDRLYPDGCEPTVEALTALDCQAFDVLWLVYLLAPRDVVQYAYRCASHMGQPPVGSTALLLVERWLAGAPIPADEVNVIWEEVAEEEARAATEVAAKAQAEARTVMRKARLAYLAQLLSAASHAGRG